MRTNAAKPLLEHLDDCLREKALGGRDERYLYGLRQGVKRLVNECGWQTTKDVSADSFETWRRRQNLNAKTLNDYLTYARTLLNWMEKRDRIPSNPLKTVGMATKGKAPVYERRALSHDEVARLLAVAGDRSFAYQTVILTGLRRAELAQLQWQDLYLAAECPHIVLRGETTKNGKADVIGLHPALVRELTTPGRSEHNPPTSCFRSFPRWNK